MRIPLSKPVLLCLALTARALASEPDGAGLQRGTLPHPFLTGGPNCVTVPAWQAQAYNEDFYILRESGCIDAEKPFLYLLFGNERALLEDTGAGQSPVAPFVMDLMARWAARKHHAPVPLVVIHSHGHGDHTAGDPQFRALPGVVFVAATPAEIQKAAGIARWPEETGRLDLGNRIVDVIPIPGHNDASIALYDRLTGNLMTGDSLYPGRLYVPAAEIPVYAASARRLAGFVRDPAHPVAHVFGTHIEQGQIPYFDFRRGTVYQPDEHALELSRAHVIELDRTFAAMGGQPVKSLAPDFSVVPRVPGVSMPPDVQAGDGLGLDPGVLPAKWQTGGPDCVSVPDWQVHAYNENFYILRESGCTHYEKPFLYLIFGRDAVLLEDTGAGDARTAPVVMDLIAKWAKKNKRTPVPLIVIHSHAHGDHIAGDKDLATLPNVRFIAATPGAITKAAGIAVWPAGSGRIELGDRVIDVIPIPGHNDASIALYDRKTGNLMTGDSLYPGRLSVSAADLPVFAASAARLAAFAEAHPVAHVLGTHIEQTQTPYLDYPRGTVYQPEEHALALTRAHVLELNDAFAGMKGQLQKVALPDFTIVPRAAPAAVRQVRGER